MRAILAQAALEQLPDAPPGTQGEDLVPYCSCSSWPRSSCSEPVCFVLVLHFVSQRRREQHADAPPEEPDADAVQWRTAGVLLVPARWMAVRATTVRDVRNALELSNATPCSIEDGLAGNHQQALFLAPPVNGWVLITGPGVPDPVNDIDEVYHILRALSIKLGAAQFFCFNRAVGHHGWAWPQVAASSAPSPGPDARSGTRANSPRPNAPSACAAPGIWTPPKSALAREAILANVDKVPLLAARWSVDPVSVHQQLPHAIGVAGEFQRIRSS